MTIDYLALLPYVFMLDPPSARPGITMSRRMAAPDSRHEPIWWKTFPSEEARTIYFDAIWSRIDTGIWPIWAAIAIERGPGVLTRHLDAIVRSLPGGEPGPDERWVSGPSRGLDYDAPVRDPRYCVEHRGPGFKVVLIDRHVQPHELTLWEQRFRTRAMADHVHSWLTGRADRWSHWAALILDHGDMTFDAYLSQQIDGYAEAIRPQRGGEGRN